MFCIQHPTRRVESSESISMSVSTYISLTGHRLNYKVARYLFKLGLNHQTQARCNNVIKNMLPVRPRNCGARQQIRKALILKYFYKEFSFSYHSQPD